MLNFSIHQLIEIYENELAHLLHSSGVNSYATGISHRQIPSVGDKMQLGGMDFAVCALEPLSEVVNPKSVNDFLNREDKEIVYELEQEGEDFSEADANALFDDDPYPGIDCDIERNWDIEGDSEAIDLHGKDAVFKKEKGEIRWQDDIKGDLRETTIAYYRSFHSAGAAFGIYYKRKGLKLKARCIYKFCMSRGYQLSMEQIFIIAKMITQFHEIYHHKIEAFASRLEVITRLPIYVHGFSSWYQRTRNTANCFEETFANYYAYCKTKIALQKFVPADALHNIMVYWFSQQPLPYRNALRLINQSDEMVRNSENQFCEIILKQFFPNDARYGKQSSRVWSMFTHGKQPYITTKSPVYYLV